MTLARRDVVAAIAGAALASGLASTAFAEDLPYNLTPGQAL